MSTIHGPSPPWAYVKGAPLELLNLSSHILLNGEERPLGEIWSAQIAGAVDEYARAGLRVLGVAQRRLPNDLTNLSPQTVESDLTFLGLAAMMDPPRPDVAGAVEKCHRAGIKVVMSCSFPCCPSPRRWGGGSSAVGRRGAILVLERGLRERRRVSPRCRRKGYCPRKRRLKPP